MDTPSNPKSQFVPETPEEITAQWLGEVLGSSVDDIAVKDLGDGIGFMGDVLLITPTSAELNDSMVAKLPKKANRVMGELLGVYEREVMFFSTLGNDVKMRIPKVYYSHYDPDKGSENQKEILAKIDQLPVFMSKAINLIGRWVAGAKKRRYFLLIEYLNGFSAGDQLAGIGKQEATTVLSEVAGLHKQFWQSNELSEHFWLLPVDIDATLREGMFHQFVDGFQTTASEALHPTLDWLRTKGRAAELTRAVMQRAPTTLLHNDLRLDNVMFSDQECALIDWQLVRCGASAFDVAYFLSSALHEDATYQDELDILSAYHQALDTQDYSFDAFVRDYHSAMVLVMANLTSVGQVELGDGRGQQVMLAWFNRLGARLQHVDLATLL